MMAADAVVIGGTTEGKAVISALNHMGLSVVVSVATQLGKDVLNDVYGMKNTYVAVGRKDRDGFMELFMQVQPEFVIDASHPFAVEVSKNVRDVCSRLNITYGRFVRENIPLNNKNYTYVSDAYKAAEVLNGIEGNILLTTGANTVGIYADTISNFSERTYIRVLNTQSSVEACLKAGLVPAHIIAQNPPFCVEDNMAIIQKYNIQAIVTKDSGNTGGLDAKLKSAQMAGIRAVIIQRPQEQSSDVCFNNIETMCRWVCELKGRK